MKRFEFPAWTTKLARLLPTLSVLAVVYLICMIAFGFSPDTTDVGYEPKTKGVLTAWYQSNDEEDLAADCHGYSVSSESFTR